MHDEVMKPSNAASLQTPVSFTLVASVKVTNAVLLWAEKAREN
jgi:hypothetical protein